MNLIKVVMILVICPSFIYSTEYYNQCMRQLPNKVVIKQAQRPAYCRTKDRTDRYNKVVEAKGRAIKCEVDDEIVTIHILYHDVIKVQRHRNKLAKLCIIKENGSIDIIYPPKEKSLFDKIWNPTSAFITGVIAGFAVGFGLSRSLK